MSLEEYFFDENCYITELLNSETDPDVSVAKVRVLKGVTTKWHYLVGITERYLILEGAGIARVGINQQLDVGPGDSVTIAPGVRQQITNTGEGDLIFLAICTPRFEVEFYQEDSLRLGSA